jgi:Zn-dependent protease with chaperone function
MKRLIGAGVVGGIALSCLIGASSPSCLHGFACLAATAAQPMDIVRAVLLSLAAGILVVTLRAGWTTLSLGRELQRLPRAGRRLELERQGVACITSVAPAAFCAGAIRPRVYVTDSLVDLLDPSALAAVIAHEQAHAQRRDPLRRSLLAALSDLLLRAPWVLWLRNRYHERAEISADRAAAMLLGPSAVADALTTLAAEGSQGSAEATGVGSTSALGLRPIFASAVATVAIAAMVLCVSQAALLLGGGNFPHL